MSDWDPGPYRSYEAVRQLFEDLYEALQSEEANTLRKLAWSRAAAAGMDPEEYEAAVTRRIWDGTSPDDVLSPSVPLVKDVAQFVVEAETGHRFTVTFDHYDRAAEDLCLRVEASASCL